MIRANPDANTEQTSTLPCSHIRCSSSFFLMERWGLHEAKEIESNGVHSLRVLFLNSRTSLYGIFLPVEWSPMFTFLISWEPSSNQISHDPSLGRWAKCDTSKIQSHIFLRLGCLMVSQYNWGTLRNMWTWQSQAGEKPGGITNSTTSYAMFLF